MPSTEEPPALRIDGLSHRYGRRTVLEGVEFSIRRGSFTVLLGPNGAGKTTLFALITAYITPPPAASRCSGATSASIRRRRWRAWASCFSSRRSTST